MTDGCVPYGQGGAASTAPPGVCKTPGPLRLGSKGGRPLVGIKRGNAPLTLFVCVISALGFLICV